MKLRNNIIIATITGGAFVVSLALLLAYQWPELVKKYQIPSKQTSGAEVETSDWLTHRDEELGVELKYPKEWKIYQSDKNLISLVSPDRLPQYMTHGGATVNLFTSHENISPDLKTYILNKLSYEIDHFYIEPREIYNTNGVKMIETQNVPGMLPYDIYYFTVQNNSILVKLEYIIDERGGTISKIINSIKIL